ncbi:MAG TPA: HAD-IIA family hydrolase [Thermomicrobiales bacterium]|nr:HAD-IIA family hydrolase [Thermomicrobiales bacterium]
MTTDERKVGRRGAIALRDAEGFIFDMDGVLYRGKRALAGVVEIFDALDARGIPYLLATNNSMATPAMYVERLKGYGVTVDASQIQTSATATRDVLGHEFPEGGTLFVVGMPALDEQLQDGTDFHITSDPTDDIVAVVVGLDQQFTYDKLAAATTAIRGGARFFATNDDATLPVEDGILPGAGSIIAAIATASGRQPTVVGKPQTLMMTDAVERLGSQAHCTVMIGDRLDTDILAAERAGLTTALVLTGVTTREELAAGESVPDYVFSDLPALTRELVGTD